MMFVIGFVCAAVGFVAGGFVATIAESHYYEDQMDRINQEWETGLRKRS